MKTEALQIDLVYDIICPWCYIGHQRLMKAIKVSNTKVEVRLIPFQIRPKLPLEGISVKAYWSAKGIEDIDKAYESIIEAADAEALIINPHQFSVIPNTLKIHQLIINAQERGIGLEVLHAIQKAFFEKGADLTKTKVLKDVLEGFFSEHEFFKAFDSKDYENQVLALEKNVNKLKISKVPTFIIDKKHRLSGAISNFMLKDMLRQLIPVVQEGEACDIDGNC